MAQTHKIIRPLLSGFAMAVVATSGAAWSSNEGSQQIDSRTPAPVESSTSKPDTSPPKAAFPERQPPEGFPHYIGTPDEWAAEIARRQDPSDPSEHLLFSGSETTSLAESPSAGDWVEIVGPSDRSMELNKAELASSLPPEDRERLLRSVGAGNAWSDGEGRMRRGPWARAGLAPSGEVRETYLISGAEVLGVTTKQDETVVKLRIGTTSREQLRLGLMTKRLRLLEVPEAYRRAGAAEPRRPIQLTPPPAQQQGE